MSQNPNAVYQRWAETVLDFNAFADAHGNRAARALLDVLGEQLHAREMADLRQLQASAMTGLVDLATLLGPNVHPAFVGLCVGE